MHTVVSASLALITFDNNPQRLFAAIADVKERGYNIDTSTPQRFTKTLEAAQKKCKNILTKMGNKKNELERQFPKKEVSTTFEELVGNLEIALGEAKILLMIDAEKLTLAKYNTLRKAVNRKAEAYERANKSGRSGAK